MAALDALIGLAGRWKGSYRLLEPSKAPQQSSSALSITPIVAERFVRMDYTWSYDGERQEGSLLLGYESKARRAVTAVWIDSWHMGHQFMTCEGATERRGAVVVRGSYASPPGPDWGWRTVIEPGRGNALRLLMYNQAPDGKEELAVEAKFVRVPTRTKRRR